MASEYKGKRDPEGKLLGEELRSQRTWDERQHVAGEHSVITGQNGVGGDLALKPAMVAEKLKPSVVHVLCKSKVCLLIFLGQQMLRPRVRQPWRHYPPSSSPACAHSAVSQCPSLGAAMTFRWKPTGKGFGERQWDDTEPEG